MKHTTILPIAGLSAILALSGVALSGCGGTSSSSDSSSGGSDKLNFEGTWESTCQYDSDLDKDVKSVVEISNGNVTQTDYAYESSCTGSATSNTATVGSYKLGNKLQDSDTGLTIQQLDVSMTDGDFKTVIGIIPDNKQVFFGENGSSYPTKVNLNDNYTKVGADLSPSGKTVRVLGHMEFDFSAGQPASDYEDADAGTIIWGPTNAQEVWGSAVWIRSNVEEEGNNNFYVYATGKTDLSQVSSAPSSWPQIDQNVPSVVKGQVYVLKLAEGNHVKLKVLSTPDTDLLNWPLLVEYEIF